MRQRLLIGLMLMVSWQTNAQIKETFINTSFEDSLGWQVTSTCEEKWELETGNASDGKHFVEFQSNEAPNGCQTVLQSEPIDIQDFHFHDTLVFNFNFYRSKGKSDSIDFMAIYLCDTSGHRIKSTHAARHYQEYEPAESEPGWHPYFWEISVEALEKTPFDQFEIAFIGVSGGNGRAMRLDGVVLSGY